MQNRQRKSRSTYTPIVPAVEQAARVLICLAKDQVRRKTLTAICGEIGIHKSKGYALLNTLKQYGFVEKDPQTKTYSLGPGLLFLSRKVLDRMDLRDVVTPFLEKLATGTQSTALFGLLSEEQVFVIAKHEGGQNIGVSIRVGHRFHVTSGAHGKAIAAFLPEPDKERLLARKKLFFFGDPSRPELAQLRAELAECRRSGFSADKGGLQSGINAVSAPVFDHRRNILGCMILMGPFPESLIPKHGRKVAETAQEVSALLGADLNMGGSRG
jgi:DNA-binding IclR family transcriptional regulator